MPATVQIRNVPDALHRRLKARAALSGLSLSDYLLREIRLLERHRRSPMQPAAQLVNTRLLDATLLTRDRKLAGARGNRARIELV